MTAAAPLTVGAVFSATVRDLGSNGDAIVEHASGRVVFVPGAWPGETVQVKVTQLKSRLARGELLSVESPSPQRRTAPCPYHGCSARHCGGCSWQFVSYSAQCEAKQRRVASELQRLGIADDVLRPIHAAPVELGYRNRAQLRSDGRRLGFLAEGGRALVDVAHCAVLQPEADALLQELRQQLPNKAWLSRRNKPFTTIDIDAVQGVQLGRRLPFRQGNDAQNTYMQHWLDAALSALPTRRHALELFAGSGNFTEIISAAGFEQITAVEAVADATAVLAARQLPGVTVLTHDLYRPGAYTDLLGEVGDCEVLVLDPPRDGLQHADELFGKQNPFREVFYISCDLATFCRDVRVMLAAGFSARLIQPLDLFPQTPHVELLAHFSRV